MEHSHPSVPHPAPHRAKVSWLNHLLGLIGAPVAWIAQMSLSYMLASSACYPHHAPLETPAWNWLVIALASITLACFAIALFSIRIAWTGWKQSRDEGQGSHKQVLEVGDGRTRFLSMIGLLANGIFLVAILFTGSVMVLLPHPHTCL